MGLKEVNWMKEWRCIQVGHHDEVGPAIAQWEAAGWRLHTYNSAGLGQGWGAQVNHYLLFVRGE
jgi:hypothetical protein